MIDYSGFAFGKGSTIDAEKAKAEREFVKRREIARGAAFKHFGGCCARCGTPLKLRPSEARHEFEIANAHEVRPRSLGGDPLNPREIVILCTKCHSQVGKSFSIALLDVDTFGRLRFIAINRSTQNEN